MKKRLILLAVIMTVVCLSLEAVSQQQAPTQQSQPSSQQKQLPPEQLGFRKDVPILIKADRMSGDRKAGMVVFEGNVVATQENAVLMSQKLTAYFTQDKKISLIVAEGNVSFVQNERKGHCDKATYYYKERRMIFEGNPIFVVGKDVVSGARIEYDMNTEKAVVFSDQTKRVEAVIFPEEGEIGSTLYPESNQGVSGPQGGGSGQH